MEFDQWLDEFKTVFRRSALPDTVRQTYERILAFMDANRASSAVGDFSADLAIRLGCELDLLFPVPDTEERVLEPQELLSQQRYEDVQEQLRDYRKLEGNVTDTVLNQAAGEGDEILCVFPAPFQLTEEEETDPGVLGDVVETLLTEIKHPVFLVRNDRDMPPDLYEHVVVVGSTFHNLIRLIRCTAGVCPEERTTLKVVAVADQRFVRSMKNLLEDTKDLDTKKTGDRLKNSLITELQRKLRHLGNQLRDQHGMKLEHRCVESSLDELIQQNELLDASPSLLAVPTKFSGGGYDAAVLRPLFKTYTDTEVLTL